jgi:hypothetical protein
VVAPEAYCQCERLMRVRTDAEEAQKFGPTCRSHSGSVTGIRMTRYAPYSPVPLSQHGHALVLGGVRDTDDALHAGSPTSTWAFMVDPVSERRFRLIIC